MTDIERIELAIRRVLATAGVSSWRQDLLALAEELAKMRNAEAQAQEGARTGYKIHWVP